jgi:hypothetical protein
MEDIMTNTKRPLVNNTQMLVLLPKEDHEFIKEVAKAKRLSMGEVVRQLIAQKRNLTVLNEGRI